MHSKLLVGITYKEQLMPNGFAYNSVHIHNHGRQVPLEQRVLTKQMTEC